MSTDYPGGRNLQAGWVTTDQVVLAIDTYYPGMLLEFQAAGAGVTTGTGDGVASDIVAGPDVLAGVYTCLFTAALVFDLKDAAGNILATDLVVPDGSAATFKVAGITFTLTDGSTAWVATDTIAMTIATTGAYLALASGTLAAIYNAESQVLASAGRGDCIMAGEIDPNGLVDASNSALTVTETQRANFRNAGFYIKRA